MVPFLAHAQSGTAVSLVSSIQTEMAMLHGNLEVSTGPNIEQMRTRLRTARDQLARLSALVSVDNTQSQATAELDGMDRELLVLQGMIEGSYINGRELMLAHIRSVQAYSSGLRALLGAPVQQPIAGPPVHGHPVVVRPPIHEPEPEPEPEPVLPNAMEPAAFMSLCSAVDAQAFSDGKLSVIRQAVASGNYFTCAQVGQLVQLLDFSDDKINAVITTYPQIIDRQNLFSIYGHFDFDSDIQELQQRLGIQ
ncbi:MAG: DUF4476 domain-containing protein [Bradymonadales bacterium]|nr:DUF4476 domain-containing protein [Bradymonadales bacterium]